MTNLFRLYKPVSIRFSLASLESLSFRSPSGPQSYRDSYCNAIAIWNASTRLGRKWSQTCWMDIWLGETFCAGVKKLKHMFEKWKNKTKMWLKFEANTANPHIHTITKCQSHGLGGALKFLTSLFHTQSPSSNHLGFARVLQKFVTDVQNQPKSELRMSNIPKSKYLHIAWHMLIYLNYFPRT